MTCQWSVNKLLQKYEKFLMSFANTSFQELHINTMAMVLYRFCLNHTKAASLEFRIEDQTLTMRI